MLYNSKIHNLPHVFKAILGNIFPFSGQKNQLIVLNYHGTQKRFIHNFIKQINYLKKQYEIISPDVFFDLANSKKQVKGKKLLLTFDDGIKNNLLAINELDNLGISALFFVVPQFIDTSIKDQKHFFVKNIRPTINPFIDEDFEDFSALSWEDLIKISKNHTIGCHTYNHTMVKDVLNKQDLEMEIIKSKEMIEDKIGLKINSFCSINNTLLTIGRKEQQLIEQNYNFHFTTFGGNNATLNSFLIKRINVESHWLQGALKFALSSFELNRWAKKIQLFKNNIK